MPELIAQKHYRNLRHENFTRESPVDDRYNCAAFALDLFTDNWWPEEAEGVTWPDGIRRDESLKSFTEGFALFGFEPCEDGELEPEYEKIVLYAVSDPDPTEAAIKHVARQLEDGRWASKRHLGRNHSHLIKRRGGTPSCRD
jgi:hypothetical protein